MQTYTASDGSTLPSDQPFTLDGIAYPANWLSLAGAADLSGLGITVQTIADPIPPVEPPPPPVTVNAMTTVTPRQARLALNAAGLLTQVNAAIAAADQPTQITWEFASFIARDDALITTLSAALGLTSTQVDGLFTLALTL